MSLPEIVQSTLQDEPVAARVELGGDDMLLVTPSRTLVYRAEGLLSDESVKEFPHDAERVEVSEGRRKSKVSLDYGLDGQRTFAVPTSRLDEALHPVLAGVLNAAGITDPGETVTQTFRFSELTLVITSARVVKHIGTAVWDGDYEEFHYEDVTDLAFEDGSVATAVVITTGDRQERFKTPNDRARAVREGLESALLAYHDVDSLEAFRATVEAEEEEAERENVAFGDGPDPLSAAPSESAAAEDSAVPTGESGDSPAGEAAENLTADGLAAAARTEAGGAEETGFDDSPFEAASDAAGDATGDDVAAELRSIRRAIEEQSEQLRRHDELIEQLIEELRQGR
ncbi:MAG: hypothetical protein ABEJ28_11415 [Salinigranum sp.]